MTKKIIHCFGDSLTAGYGFTEEHAYPGVLQKILDENDYDYQVINDGISGETTHGGLMRIKQSLASKPDIFILELGINDGLRGLDLNKTRDNLEKIIETVKHKYPKTVIVIAGMQLPTRINNPYVTTFLNIFPDLAEKYNTALITSFLQDVMGIPSLNLPDKLHPNKQGYNIIAQTVFNSLKPYLIR